jgi:hypothetical protein
LIEGVWKRVLIISSFCPEREKGGREREREEGGERERRTSN